jgi:hypothetical protein
VRVRDGAGFPARADTKFRGKWWRRRESKPEDFVANGRETSPNVASDERETTFRDETRRAIAKPPNTRTALVADLADYVKLLALAGDLEAARIALTAIARLLGGFD